MKYEELYNEEQRKQFASFAKPLLSLNIPNNSTVATEGFHYLSQLLVAINTEFSLRDATEFLLKLQGAVRLRKSEEVIDIIQEELESTLIRCQSMRTASRDNIEILENQIEEYCKNKGIDNILK